MLQDELLQQRYLRHVERLIDLARHEVERTAGQADLNGLSRMYLERFEQTLQAFTGRYGCNILTGFKLLQEQGALELITTGATHSFLPLQIVPQCIEAQVQLAIHQHHKTFGLPPRGFWLPECGYAPGLEDFLHRHHLGYFFVDAHGVLLADPKPRSGVYAPLYCPNGVAAFGRDPESSNAVWSARDGYPGHPVYREFYRDVGFDLPQEYMQPYLQEGGVRVNTGIKYYAVTGRTEEKRLYNRAEALKKAREHAEHFLASRRAQIDRLASLMDRPPVFVCPYDAELFGHWWFEGPEWIESLIRLTASQPNGIEMLTPSDYLKRHPDNPIAQPSFSSWGNKGYAEVWLEGSNDWIYRHLHKAGERMVDIARRFNNAEGLRKRALNQAARELLLSQASDWAFIMKTGTTVPYAVRRTREHIHNFNTLYEAIMTNKIDQKSLSRLERKYTIFKDIDYRLYAG
jgi:1,4-alpha-glucan branching enzyme